MQIWILTMVVLQQVLTYVRRSVLHVPVAMAVVVGGCRGCASHESRNGDRATRRKCKPIVAWWLFAFPEAWFLKA